MITRFSTNKLSYTQRYRQMMAGNRYRSPNWLETVYAPSSAINNIYYNCVAVDPSSGAACFIGYADSTSNDIVLVKTGPTGDISWQTKISSASADTGNSVAISSSGNVFIVGTSASHIFLAKYNSAGALQWQRTLSSATSEEGNGITVDSSENVYIAGTTSNGNGASRSALIAKYDTSGTLLWQRYFFNSGVQTNGTAIKVDSSGNTYTVGYTNKGSFPNQFEGYVVKYDTSGTLVWQRLISTGSDDYCTNVALDSSGQPHITTTTYGGAGLGISVTKLNTSGTSLWQVAYGASGDSFNGITIDSSNNVYIAGTVSGVSAAYFYKHDSSGNLVWQRRITHTGGDPAVSLATAVGDDIIFAGYTAATSGTVLNGGFAGKLKADGSLTATYTLNGLSYVYESTTVATTGAPGVSTPAWTSATAALTSAASSLTSSTSTYLVADVNMP